MPLTTFTKWGLLRIVLLLAATGALAGFVLVPAYHEDVIPPPADTVDRLDSQLAEAGCRLAPIASEIPEGVQAVHCTLTAPVSNAGFYIRNSISRQALLYQKTDDAAADSLYLYPGHFVMVAAGGKPLLVHRLAGWELFAVVPPGSEPDITRAPVHRFEMEDSFMRTELAADDGWKVHSGTWKLKQYGGGLAANESEAESSGFQRAVNPFSVVGQGPDGKEGVLEFVRPTAYGDGWLTEARFYLGQPHRGPTAIVDKSLEVPHFLVSQGDINGQAAAFGWWSPDKDTPSAWRLLTRPPAATADAPAPWTVIGEWHGRPPLSNWTRVGLAIAFGHQATPMLDGTPLATVPLPFMLHGIFHIRTGNAGKAIEFDDVAAHPWPEPEDNLGTPVVVKSSGFSAKDAGDYRDPAQFGQWAKGEKAFILHKKGTASLGITVPYAVVRYPFYGDFNYRSEPRSDLGSYRFLIADTPTPQEADQILLDLRVECREQGWLLEGDPSPGFTLDFGRRDGHFFASTGNLQHAFDTAFTGPVYLLIVPPSRAMLVPGRQQVYSRTLWHDLFENAPTDWSWQDGHFGMNVRWACQPGWNFMAGKSVDLAALHSKYAYHGDQVIDAFTSFCFTLPGDEQYYIRRDICVSFCTDGRNLDSGYTLIFGGDNNTRTMLLKRGKLIGSTSDPEFLFPVGVEHTQVHWRWWNFEIHKEGRLLTVVMNGETMLRVDDPDPIEGGHVAFWTVGNGFVLSRLTVAAESRTLAPLPSRFDWAQTAAGLPWQSLRRDAVGVSAAKGGVTVHNPVGGGSFAVRTSTTANLTQTPILVLPINLQDDAKVNLHLQIDGRSYVVQLTAPVQQMPRFLTPNSERDIDFTRELLSDSILEQQVLGIAAPMEGVLHINLKELLEAKNQPVPNKDSIMILTIGNSSNDAYLMAGFGGNPAGTEYWLGTPSWQ